MRVTEWGIHCTFLKAVPKSRDPQLWNLSLCSRAWGNFDVKASSVVVLRGLQYGGERVINGGEVVLCKQRL